VRVGMTLDPERTSSSRLRGRFEPAGLSCVG
jgi:hypothetical protein